MTGSTDVGELVESLEQEQWDAMRNMLSEKQKPLLEAVLQKAKKAKDAKRKLGRADRTPKQLASKAKDARGTS